MGLAIDHRCYKRAKVLPDCCSEAEGTRGSLSNQLRVLSLALSDAFIYGDTAQQVHWLGSDK